MDYVFHWRRESLWVVVTALMTYLMTLTASDFENVADWKKLAISIGAGAVRAVLGALLATRSGGFRPEVPTGPSVPTIDEQVGVSPRKVATPNQPDKPDDPLDNHPAFSPDVEIRRADLNRTGDFWDGLGRPPKGS